MVQDFRRTKLHGRSFRGQNLKGADFSYADTELSTEDKQQALEQVKALAEAGKNPQESAMQKIAKTAMTMLRGTIAVFPNLLETCNLFLPSIAQIFELK